MISKEDEKAMLLSSIKNNQSNPFSNMTAEAKIMLRDADEKGFVETKIITKWYPKINIAFAEHGVYRIVNGYYPK